MPEGIHALARLDDEMNEMNGFEYTSVQVSVSEGMILHRDANNLGPNWTISMGEFQGGLLGVKSKEGRTRPACTAPGLGPSVERSFRLSLVFFNNKSLLKLLLDDWQQLEDLKFPCLSIGTHYGETSTAASLDVDKCSHETSAGSGETHSEESRGSNQEPEDVASFFDVKNDFKLPPGIAPEP
eukprot:2936949-Prorocentrum_lima.AAC.1